MAEKKIENEDIDARIEKGISEKLNDLTEKIIREKLYARIPHTVFWQRIDHRTTTTEKLATGWQAMWASAEKYSEIEDYSAIDLTETFTLEPELSGRLEEFTLESNIPSKQEALQIILHVFLMEHGYLEYGYHYD
jgi:hypothetical protein